MYFIFRSSFIAYLRYALTLTVSVHWQRPWSALSTCSRSGPCCSLHPL